MPVKTSAPSAHKLEFDIQQHKAGAKFAARFIWGLALVLLTVSVIGWPCPFVRRIWFKELWGLYGVFCTIFFCLVAEGMTRMNAGAAFSGFGPLLYEQILTWRGYDHLGPMAEQPHVKAYLMLSVVTTVVTALFLIRGMQEIHAYRRIKRKSLRIKEKPGESKPFLYLTGLIYIIALALTSWFANFASDAAFASFKLLGLAVSFVAFLAIGLEWERFFIRGKLEPFSWFAILFHSATLLLILWFVHLYMPFEELAAAGPS